MSHHPRHLAMLSVALLFAGAGLAFAQTGSSGGSSSGGTSSSGGATSSAPGMSSQPGGGISGPTVRAPSSNPSAVAPPATVTTPSSNPSAAQQPTVAVPATRPGCNPSQQSGSPSIAGTGTIGTASVSGGVTARQDNQVMTGSPQTPASNPRTPAISESAARGAQTTGARSGGSVDTGTPRIANDPALGTGRTVQTNPGVDGISSVTGTPGAPSAQSPGLSAGASPSASPRSGSVASGC